MHPWIGLLYLDSEEVPRKPREANVTPLKTKAQKHVKLGQCAVKVAAGEAEVIEAA